MKKLFYLVCLLPIVASCDKNDDDKNTSNETKLYLVDSSHIEYANELKARNEYITYNSFGLVTQRSTQYFENGALTEMRKSSYVFDENGNEIEYSTAKYDLENKEWIEDNKTKQEFDSHGNLTMYMFYFFDNETQSLVAMSKSELFYNSKNQHTESISYYKSNNEWVQSTKTIYDNSYKIPVMTFQFDWNEYSSSWQSYRRFLVTVDENNYPKSIIAQDTSYEAWVNRNKTEYQYSSTGKIQSYSYYQWENETESWKGQWRYEIKTLSNDNPLSYKYYSWDELNSTWKESGNAEYTYNANGTRKNYTYISTFNDMQYGNKEEYIYDKNKALITTESFLLQNNVWKKEWTATHFNSIHTINKYPSKTNISFSKDPLLLEMERKMRMQ